MQKQKNKSGRKTSRYRRILIQLIIISGIGCVIYAGADSISTWNSKTTDARDHRAESSDGWAVENVPHPKTNDARNWVCNPDGILSPAVEEEINTMLQKLADSLTIEVAVVALRAIEGGAPRDFAHQLFNTWGVGKAEDDNGLVMLLTLDLRDITFETGYGLEGVLPDVVCKRIQMNAMVPYFRENDWDKGMTEGVKAVTATLCNSDYIAAPPQTKAKDWVTKFLRNMPPLVVTAFAMLFLFLNYLTWKTVTRQLKPEEATPLSALNLLAKGNKLNIITLSGLLWLTPLLPILPVIAIWYWVWQCPRTKRLSLTCPHCKAIAMRSLSKKEMSEPGESLSDSERMELKLGTVYLRVHVCTVCGEILKQRIALAKGYECCPDCNNMTLEGKEKFHTVKKATTTSEGLREAMHKCRYCGTEYIVGYKIPEISTSSSGSGSHGGSGGSSSGGSFGGGSSGGGGSSSRF